MSRVTDVLNSALRDEWDGLDRINKDLRWADLFTILNACMGFAAIVLATQGQVRTAIQLVLAGMIMDGLDGAMARLGKGNGPLGPTLDSLADTVTFVVAPSVITVMWFNNGPYADRFTDLQSWVLILLPMGLYLVCGLLRLARFESMRDDGKERKYFSGMATPGAAMILLSLILVGDIPPPFILGIACYLAILMVSRIRFPKLRGWLGVLAAGILLAVLVSFRDTDRQTDLTYGLLAFATVYLIFGPFYVLARFGPTQVPESPGES